MRSKWLRGNGLGGGRIEGAARRGIHAGRGGFPCLGGQPESAEAEAALRPGNTCVDHCAGVEYSLSVKSSELKRWLEQQGWAT